MFTQLLRRAGNNGVDTLSNRLSTLDARATDGLRAIALDLAFPTIVARQCNSFALRWTRRGGYGYCVVGILCRWTRVRGLVRRIGQHTVAVSDWIENEKS